MADRFTREGLARFGEIAASHVGDDTVPGLVALVACDEQLHVEVLREKFLAVLAGEAGLVAGSVRRKASNLGLTKQQRAKADECATYLMNKKRHLDYPTALRNGWPIATGVIEGAVRFVVRDRFGITGARWGLDGAEAILKLRAVRANGDWPAQQLAIPPRTGVPPGSRVTLRRRGHPTVLTRPSKRAAPISKPVTGVATMALVDEGLVSLDRLLPELADRRVLVRMDGPLTETRPASRAITVRDLLTFTFGLGKATWGNLDPEVPYVAW